MTAMMFGNTRVPHTVSWDKEDRFYVGRCEFAGGAMAICQSLDQGNGKPMFGKPHSQRQRQTIAQGRCDLCGTSLEHRTKVSLSHARLRQNGAEGPCIMQVEPMLHKECAADSLRFCPSLKRDINADSLMIRQVKRYRVQFAIMSPEYVGVYVPDYVAKPTDRIVGHAKIELLDWIDRDQRWLGVAA